MSSAACALPSGSVANAAGMARSDPHIALSSLLESQFFVLGMPTRSELRRIVKGLRDEHEGTSPCDLMDSFEGFRSMDAIEAWCIQAWKRGECLVLHQPTTGKDVPSEQEEILARASSLLVRGDPAGRWLLPTFATVMVAKTVNPYIELLWVEGSVRRMGIGSLMVREVCRRQPGIRRVKAPLREAEPFWNTVGNPHSVEHSWVLHQPGKQPLTTATA